MLELALRFMSIGAGHVICLSKIIAIVPTGTRMADRIISEGKKTQRFMNFTGGTRARSVILMENGLVVTTRMRTETLFKRIVETPEAQATNYKEEIRPTYNFIEDQDLAKAVPEESVPEDSEDEPDILDDDFYNEDDPEDGEEEAPDVPDE